MQQNLFAGLADSMKQLGSADIPVLKTALSGMATAINTAARQFVQFATSKDAIAQYTTIFANINTAAMNLTAAVKPILQMFTDIADVGSSFLPGLAKGFAEAAQRAADFIRQAKDSGKLKEWIQQGIDAAKTLFGIIGDLVAIFKDLASGSGHGTGLLDLLKAITGDIRWFLENVPHATTVVELFIAAWALSPIFAAIGTVVGAIGTIVGALTPATAGVAGLAAAAEGAAGVAGGGGLLAMLGPVGLLVAAAATLGFGISKALGHVNTLGSVSRDVAKAITDAFTPIPAIATGAMAGLNVVVNEGAHNIADTIGKLPAQTAASLVELAPAMRAPAEAAMAGLLPIIASGIQNIVNDVQGLSPRMQAALAPLSPAMQQSMQSALGGLLPIVDAGITNITNAAAAANPITFIGDAAGVLAAAQSATSATQGVPTQFLTTFLGEPGAVVAAAATAIGQINAVPGSHATTLTGDPTGAVGAANTVIGQIAAIPADHATAINGDPSGATGAAQSATGAINAVPQTHISNINAKDNASPVLNYVIGLMNAIHDVTSTITTVYRTITGGAAGGIMTPMAAGGVVGMAPGGNLTPNMSAGVARIVAPNTWRVIGDRMHDDEGFIPINNSASSTAILGEVARRKGFGLTPMASGGINSRDQRAWDWLEQLLRRWRGHGHGGGGGLGGPRVPTTTGTSELRRLSTSLGFGGSGGTASYMRTAAAPMTQLNPVPTFPTPPSGGHGQPGGGQQPVVLQIRTDQSRYGEFLAGELRRYVRVSGGGNVQLAFGQ